MKRAQVERRKSANGPFLFPPPPLRTVPRRNGSIGDTTARRAVAVRSCAREKKVCPVGEGTVRVASAGETVARRSRWWTNDVRRAPRATSLTSKTAAIGKIPGPCGAESAVAAAFYRPEDKRRNP